MRHSTGRWSYGEIDTIPTYLPAYFRDCLHTGRGTGHQVATTNTIVAALVQQPLIAQLIDNSQICYFAGAKAGRQHRNLDLVLGPPGPGAQWDSDLGMLYGMPTQVLAAGEYKTIMTEHGKNAGNRSGELLSHASRSRTWYGSETVVFGVCPVNAADDYYSYTAGITRQHGDGRLQASRSLDVLRDCLRNGADSLDLLWTPVIVANNDPDEGARIAGWLRGRPQPPDGDELGWGHFLEGLARRYARIA